MFCTELGKGPAGCVFLHLPAVLPVHQQAIVDVRAERLEVLEQLYLKVAVDRLVRPPPPAYHVIPRPEESNLVSKQKITH